jgi:hypothetical protein
MHLYLLPNDWADKHREILEGSQGHFVNTGSKNDAVMALFRMIYRDSHDIQGAVPELVKYQMLQDVIRNVSITYVYWAGVVLV